MRDNILRTIQSKVHIQKTISLGGSVVSFLEGEELAADELTALMCYREVRAYYLGYNDWYTGVDWEQLGQEMLGHFSENYPEQTIREAIEKVKNEME